MYKNLNKAIPNSNKNFGGNNSLEMRNTGFGPAEDFRVSEDNTLRQEASFTQLEKQKFSSHPYPEEETLEFLKGKGTH